MGTTRFQDKSLGGFKLRETESNIKQKSKIYRVWKFRNPEIMMIGNRGAPTARAVDREEQGQENNSKTKTTETNGERDSQIVTCKGTM